MGTDTRVDIKSNVEACEKLKKKRKNTLLFMHNHPSTSTFSGEDFKTFCSNESLYIMTVVGNDGSVYALVKTKEFNREEALLYYYNLALKKHI